MVTDIGSNFVSDNWPTLSASSGYQYWYNIGTKLVPDFSEKLWRAKELYQKTILIPMSFKISNKYWFQLYFCCFSQKFANVDPILNQCWGPILGYALVTNIGSILGTNIGPKLVSQYWFTILIQYWSNIGCQYWKCWNNQGNQYWYPMLVHNWSNIGNQLSLFSIGDQYWSNIGPMLESDTRVQYRLPMLVQYWKLGSCLWGRY